MRQMVDARIEHIPEDWLGASELNTGSPTGGDSGQFVAQLVGNRDPDWVCAAARLARAIENTCSPPHSDDCAMTD